MYQSINHEGFIRESYILANRAARRGDHPFGALLVRDNVILSTAENTVVTTHDRTRHAELNLLMDAPQNVGPDWFTDSILYTSTEPCIMCSGAIYWSGVSTVVFGCSAKLLAEFAGNDLTISCKEIFAWGKRPIVTIGPVLEGEGGVIHKIFW